MTTSPTQTPTQTPTPPASFPTKLVLIMGVMIAIGPLAIDMYLPALPRMADDFGVDTASVARSVPAYFIGLVVGQLFYGPWSDRVGRVLPLYVGMSIFVLASIMCALAVSDEMLFVSRTLQALGACVTAVVTRASIRDMMTPVQMARAYGLMMLVMGVAPIVAPSVGAVMLKFFEWRALFWFLAGYGVLNMVLAKLFLKETLAKENRNTAPIRQTFYGYWSLLQDKRFLLPAVVAGLLQGSFFIYLASASELFMVQYGLSEQKFALLFGVNAFGFIALTQLNQFLTKRYHLVQLLRVGAVLQLVSAICVLSLGLIFGANAPLWAVFCSVFCCMAGLGLTQPNAGAISLAHQKHRAGMASATQGALQFSVGIFGGLMLSAIAGHTVIKLGVSMVLLVGLGTLLVFRLNPKMRLE